MQTKIPELGLTEHIRKKAVSDERNSEIGMKVAYRQICDAL